MEYKRGKAWGYAVAAAVSLIPAAIWIEFARYLEGTACESNGCDHPEWAHRQVWLAAAAVVAWLLALAGGWLDRLWPLVTFGVLAIALALAWLLALAAV
jgi:hypothetical protein